MDVVAYYLGQYHPLKENDETWGAGFTEWHNVAKARPLFPNHRQPVLPGELGFYDLRLEETIEAQISYAKRAGVTAFCYWHYWFSGKRVLYSPLDKLIRRSADDIKIMLGWANESWTGIWHGMPNRIIFKQEYGRDELVQHAKLLAKYFESNNYLKIDRKSPLLIYKPRQIPDSKTYLEELRELVQRNGGGDLYLIGTWGPGANEQIGDPNIYGLDAVVANNVGPYFSSDVLRRAYYAAWKIIKSFGLGPEVRQYKDTIRTLRAAKSLVTGVVHSSIVTGWDNTPRVGRRGLVLTNFDYEIFSEAVRVAVELEQKNNNKIIFVKSWNEWAEGNCVEPKYKESWTVADALKSALWS